MTTPLSLSEPLTASASAAVPLFGSLLKIGARPLETVHGTFTAHLFQNLTTRNLMIVLTLGDITTPAPLLARVHSSCITSELFGAGDCDCAEQLNTALGLIAREGRGALFYLLQEGRGAGMSAKARDRMLVQASRQRLNTYDAYRQMGLAPDPRNYDEISTVYQLLGIQAPLELLSNNPDKSAALRDAGISVTGLRSIQAESSPLNVHYLVSKRRFGHRLGAARTDAHQAEPPTPVVPIDPTPVPNAPHLIETAAYWLPVKRSGDAPVWLQLHVYFDLSRAQELVLLAYGEGAQPLVRIQRENILERFPLRQFAAKSLWWETLAALVAHGHGYALFLPTTLPDATYPQALDDGAVRLLHHRLAGRPARVLLADDDAFDQSVSAALRGHGITLLDPLRVNRTHDGHAHTACCHPQPSAQRAGHDCAAGVV